MISILFFLYYIPFVGVILIFLRKMVYNDKKYFIGSMLFGCGIFLFLPKLIYEMLRLLNSDFVIPFISDIVNASWYSTNFISYAKTLSNAGVIFLLLEVVFNKLALKLKSLLSSYMFHEIKKDEKIQKENDLLIKEKQARAKTTRVKICPYCGADNILTENTGVCSYCRRKLE